MSINKPSKAPEKFIQLLEKAMREHPQKPSLREVARQASLSPAYLSYLLSGDRGVPSNEGIVQLARVLNIPEGELFNAAGKPNDAALEFFRREETASIMQKLSNVPQKRLPEVNQFLERILKKARKS